MRCSRTRNRHDPCGVVMQNNAKSRAFTMILSPIARSGVGMFLILLVTVQEGSAQTEDAIESVVDRLETRSEGGTDLTGITAQDIDGAAFVGQALPEGASAL